MEAKNENEFRRAKRIIHAFQLFHCYSAYASDLSLVYYKCKSTVTKLIILHREKSSLFAFLLHIYYYNSDTQGDFTWWFIATIMRAYNCSLFWSKLNHSTSCHSNSLKYIFRTYYGVTMAYPNPPKICGTHFH
jgi:hypothetical protein